METKNKNEQQNQSLKSRTASRVSKEFRENPQTQLGGEVEDAIQHIDTLEAAGREEAVQNFKNIFEDSEVQTKEKTVDNGDGEKLSGAKIEDSPLEKSSGEDFKPEVDTDFSPHQGEVASAVVGNPADLVYGVDRPRRIRDRNLPEGFASFEYALKPGMMFPDWDGSHNRDEMMDGEPDMGGENRMWDPRYFTFELLDGEEFHAMGTPTATQLNSGTPVGEDMDADEFFYEFFNGGEKASMPDIAMGLSTLFDADPLFSGNRENGYEIEVESGRDMIYDLFVSESDAVSREEADERWGDELGESLRTNENYGRIEELTNISEEQAVEDYVEIVMSRPAKLAPDLEPSHIKFENPEEVLDELLDEEELSELDDEDISLEYLQAVDDDREWSKQWAVFDQSRQEMNLQRLEEEREFKGKILFDGELVDVTVDHSSMNDEEFNGLMDTYFDVQNTMVRPDAAPKTNGVIESRNFSHSDRTYHALLTQKAMLDSFQELQRRFYEAGMTSENAEEMRERFVKDGLDAELPDYNPIRFESDNFYEDGSPLESEGVSDGVEPAGTLREFYRFEVLPVLEEGVRDAFNEETPYVVQKLAENYDYEDFEQDVLSEFDNMGELLEYQDLTEDVAYDPSADYSEEAEAFADWFADTAYREKMEHWLDPETLTVNEELRDYANNHSPKKAIKSKKRVSHNSYEAGT